MPITLISNTNQTTPTHAQTIIEGISSAVEIRILTAFLKSSGLDLISGALKLAIDRGATVKVIVGLDFHTTDPKALRKLYELMGSNEKEKVCLMICVAANETFHPKLYFWKSKESANIVVGSANLTGGGLRTNIELSILHTVPLSSALENQVFAFFDDTVESHKDRIKKATDLVLSQYEREWKIFSDAKYKAEAEARAIIAKEFLLDYRKIPRYLDKYLGDSNEQNAWKAKCKKYKRARTLLDKLLRKPRVLKREFQLEYERLIEGDDHLWSSGGLSRQKRGIINGRNKFLAILRAIKDSVGDTASIARSLGEIKEQAKEINGLGWNVITEILNTYAPKKFGVFNRNSTASLEYLGIEKFKNPSQANVDKYLRFNRIVTELAKEFTFTDLSQVDHFLNYVYWNHVKAQN